MDIVDGSQSDFLASQDLNIKELGSSSTNLVLKKDTQSTLQEWKRNEILEELLRTEIDYLRDISILKTVFADPCFKFSILPETKAKSIFLDLAGILQASRKIVALLENSFGNRDSLITTIIEIFSSPEVYFTPFASYCKDFTCSSAILSLCIDRYPRFKDFLEKCNLNPQTRNLSLQSFIIKPVQRICKYPLIIKELIQTATVESEKAKLSECSASMSSFIDKVNKDTTPIVFDERLRQLEKHFATNNVLLSFPGRQFIREDAIFVYQGMNRKPRRLLLLSDSVLILKKDWKDKLHIVFEKDLEEIEVLSYQNSNGSHIFVINMTNKDGWLDQYKGISGKEVISARSPLSKQFLMTLPASNGEKGKSNIFSQKRSKSVDHISGPFSNNDRNSFWEEPIVVESFAMDWDSMKYTISELEREKGALQEELNSFKVRGNEANQILEAKLATLQKATAEKLDYYEEKEKESLTREVELKSQVIALREELKNQLVLNEREKQDISGFAEERCRAYEETLDRKDLQINSLKEELGKMENALNITISNFESRLKSEIESKEKHITSLSLEAKEQTKHYTEDLDQMKFQFDVQEKQYREDIKKHRQQVESLNTSLDNSAKKINDMKFQIEKFEELCKTQKLIMEDQKTEISKLITKFNEQKDLNDSARAKFNLEISELSQLNNELQLKIQKETLNHQNIIIDHYEELKSVNERSQKEIESASIKNHNLHQEIEKLTTLLSKSEESFRSSQQQVSNLQQANSSLLTEIVNLSEKCKVAEDTSEKEKELINKKLADLVKALQEGKSEKDQLKIYVQEFESKNRDLSSTLRSHVLELSRLKSTLLDVNRQYEEVKSCLEQYRTNHSRTNEDFSETKQSLERQIKLMEQELMQYKNLHNQDTTTIAFLSHELERDRASYQELQKRHEAIVSNLHQAESQLAEIRLSKNELLHEIHQKDQNLLTEAENLKHCQEKLMQLEDFQKNANLVNSENRKTIDNLSLKLKDFSDVKKRLHEIEKERQVLYDQVKVLETRLDTERSAWILESRNLQQKIQEQFETSGQKQKDIDSLKSKVSSLQADLEESKKETKSKVETCLFLQNECNLLQKNCKTLQQHLDQDENRLRSQVTQYHQSFSQLMRELEIPKTPLGDGDIEVLRVCHDIAERYRILTSEKMKAETTLKCLELDKNCTVDVMEKEIADLKFVNKGLETQNNQLEQQLQESQVMIKDLDYRSRKSRELSESRVIDLEGKIQTVQKVGCELFDKVQALQSESKVLASDSAQRKEAIKSISTQIISLANEIQGVRDCASDLRDSVTESLEQVKHGLSQLSNFSVTELQSQISDLIEKQKCFGKAIEERQAHETIEMENLISNLQETIAGYREVLEEIFEKSQESGIIFTSNKIRKARNSILNPTIETNLDKIELALGLGKSGNMNKKDYSARFMSIFREIDRIQLEHQHLKTSLWRKSEELTLTRKMMTNR